MNGLIVNVLQSEHYIEKIQNKLPPAFEMVGQQASGPEVGTLREAVLIGMFKAFLGDDEVVPSDSAVEPDIDCSVGGVPLSIKTVTGSGGIRLKWTANAALANEFIRNYYPTSDLLIARIVWNGEGSLSYIPLEVQQTVYAEIGQQYLDYRANTNTRGVNISGPALASVQQDPTSIDLPLPWFRSIPPQSRYERWIQYWRDP